MRVWTRQPPAGTGIDWSNPIARGLVFAVIPSPIIPYDAVSNRFASIRVAGTIPTYAAKPVEGAWVEGAATAAATGGARFTFPTYSTGLDKISGPCSIFSCFGIAYSSATAAYPVFQSGDTAQGRGVGMGTFATNSQIQAYYNNSTTDCGGASGAMGASFYGPLSRVAFSMDGANIVFYAQGRQWSIVANASLPTAYSGRSTTVYGNWTNGPATPLAYTVGLAWDRVITLAEYQALHQNPWQLFAPLPKRRIYSLPGGAIWNVSLAESASASDNLSTQLVAAATLIDVGSAADSLSALASFVAALAESGAAADTHTAIAQASAALAESGAAADVIAATAQTSPALAESGSAVDTLSNGSIYAISLSESATTVDAISALTSAVAALSEAAAAVDVLSAAQIGVAALSEAGAALDTLTVTLTALASVAESGNAADTLVGTSSIAVAIVETANAQDAIRLVQLAIPFDAERLVALPYGKRMVVLAYGRHAQSDGYDRRVSSLKITSDA